MEYYIYDFLCTQQSSCSSELLGGLTRKLYPLGIFNDQIEQVGYITVQRFCDSIRRLKENAWPGHDRCNTFPMLIVELDMIVGQIDELLVGCDKTGYVLEERLGRLKRYSDGSTPIVLRSLTGKLIPLNVDLFGPVIFVKRMLQDKDGIPVDQQRFIFQGRGMQNCKCAESSLPHPSWLILNRSYIARPRNH